MAEASTIAVGCIVAIPDQSSSASTIMNLMSASAAIRVPTNARHLTVPVTVADGAVGGLALELAVLRVGTDHGERVDLVVHADRCQGLHDDMVVQCRAFADRDVRADDAIGPDAYGVGKDR